MRYLFLIALLILAACGSTQEDLTPAAEPIISQATDIPTITPTPTEAPGHPCFNLTEADCEVIVAAGDNMAALQSFAYDFDLSVTASGLEALALLLDVPSTLVLTASGDGEFVFGVDDMPFYATFNITADATQDEQAVSPLTLNLTLVDGNLYLPANDEIVGVPFTAETIDALQLPLDVGSLLPIDSLLNARPADFGTFIMRDDLGTMLNPSGTPISGYSDFVRSGDDFVFTLDIKALLNSPDFARALMAAGGQAGDDPTVSFALQLLPTLLSEVESQATITQTVTDGYISHLVFVFEFEIDLAALLSTAPRDPEAESNPIRLDVVFDLRPRDFNAVTDITAPENARILTVEELQAIVDDVIP